MTDWLTAKQAAARLGIKLETLYAYVSRGQIDRSFDEAGASLFCANYVERFAQKKSFRGRVGGLDVMLTTSIFQRDCGTTYYRGKNVIGLAEEGSFEDVAETLWNSKVSSTTGWFPSPRTLECVKPYLRHVSHAQELFGRLLLTAAALACAEREVEEEAAKDVLVKARDALYFLSIGLDGLPAGNVDQIYVPDGMRISERLWSSLAGREPGISEASLMNFVLVLAAENDLSPSTLAVRVAASTRAGYYAAINAGLQVISAPYHAGAADFVQQTLSQTQAMDPSGVAFVERYGANLISTMSNSDSYIDPDQRAAELLKKLLAFGFPESRTTYLKAVLKEARKAGLPPLPYCFATGAFAYLADMRQGAAAVIFSLARVSGWTAHFIEEQAEPLLRFKGRSHFVPLKRRNKGRSQPDEPRAQAQTVEML